MNSTQQFSSTSKLNIKGLCLDFSALGLPGSNGMGVLSPALNTAFCAMTMGSMQVDPDSEDPHIGDPDHYEVNYVPLPHVLPNELATQISRVSKFRTSFMCPAEKVMGKRVLASGISMLKCLEGSSNLIDGDEKLHEAWDGYGAGNGTINIVISWPGYDAHTIANIAVYNPSSKVLITRLELVKLISMHYFLFFDYLTMHENNAEQGEFHEAEAIAQDSLWRVGLRGYMFDRVNIMSVTQMFDNFCKIELSVMTRKGFPESVQYP